MDLHDFFPKGKIIKRVLLSTPLIFGAFLLCFYLFSKYFHNKIVFDFNFSLLEKTHLTLQGKNPNDLCQEKQWQNLLAISVFNSSGETICQNFPSFIDKNRSLFSSDPTEAISHLEKTKKEWREFKQGYLYLITRENSVIYEYIIPKINSQTESLFFLKRRFDSLLFFVGIFFLIFQFLSQIGIAYPLFKIFKQIQAISQEKKNFSEEELTDESLFLEKMIEDQKKQSVGQVKALYLEQEKLQQVINTLKDPIVAIDPKGQLIFANDSFKTYFLPTSRKQEFLQVSFWDLLRDLDLEEMAKNIFEKKEENGLKMASFASYQGQEKRHFKISMGGIKDINHSIVGILFLFHDIHELALAEAMRKDFVANISHEVKTPITVLQSQLTSLHSLKKKHDLPEEVLHWVESGLKTLKKIQHLFHSLMELSEVEFLDRPQLEECFFPAYIEDLLEVFKSKYSALNKQINVSFSEGLETIQIDKKLLDRSLGNLLDNAFKYARTTISLEISCETPKNILLFKVKDDGELIPKELETRIFERFFRAPQQTILGTGLGLAMAKHAAEKMGGKLILKQKEKEKEKIFELEIPLIF